ncbi:hypothetical protein C2E21_5544 [Chlorella sorokiniana]|uniref:Uncharacterized protein n=1 Tax=Chlorella sorokiniana TaxID=3076 RepID=A0A2P6TN47_CHLSO|nr:hypothetical protein C2E21_5544 [Chlorella sorokiniana]|eukprot:PRW50754.1 hypothetical protein C2E21_5544 [Chlorella sorokiniana]
MLDLPVSLDGGLPPAAVAGAAPPDGFRPESSGPAVSATPAQFATQAAIVLTENNDTSAAETVATAAALAFADGQPAAAVAFAQATAASMAFGPSETLNQAVMEAFSQGGDFSSYFGSALATAAANLLAVGADAAAVPTAFVESMADAAAEGFGPAASQALAAALSALRLRLPPVAPAQPPLPPST